MVVWITEKIPQASHVTANCMQRACFSLLTNTVVCQKAESCAACTTINSLIGTKSVFKSDVSRELSPDQRHKSCQRSLFPPKTYYYNTPKELNLRKVLWFSYVAIIKDYNHWVKVIRNPTKPRWRQKPKCHKFAKQHVCTWMVHTRDG